MGPRTVTWKSRLGRLRALLGSRRGATAVEYGLIVSLVVIAAFAALAEVGNVTTGMWNNISTKVQAAH